MAKYIRIINNTNAHRHNVGNVDLWLAPHRGSVAIGVVYANPKQISFGDADSHPLTPIYVQT